jgi:hypothetical protein
MRNKFHKTKLKLREKWQNSLILKHITEAKIAINRLIKDLLCFFQGADGSVFVLVCTSYTLYIWCQRSMYIYKFFVWVNNYNKIYNCLIISLTHIQLSTICNKVKRTHDSEEIFIPSKSTFLLFYFVRLKVTVLKIFFIFLV